MCDLDPKVKVIDKKAGICDGVPSTASLVLFYLFATAKVKFTSVQINMKHRRRKRGILLTSYKVNRARGHPPLTLQSKQILSAIGHTDP